MTKSPKSEEKATQRYEQRAFTVSDLRLETRHRGEAPTIVGHAAVFNQIADLGYIRERIAPGAFTRTLNEGGTVYALLNHDPNYVIASTNDKSLRLSEDKVGLVAEMDPMDTSTIRDMVVKPIQDGKINKMSFGFSVASKGESVESDRHGSIRVLEDLDLFDVSPVTFPAYAGTDVQARISSIAGRIERSLPLSKDDEELVRTVIAILSRRLPMPQEGQAEDAKTEKVKAEVISAGVLAASRERDLLLRFKKGI